MIERLLRDMGKKQSVLLKNRTCPYCGVKITNQNDSKEHVIGRNFVPVGSFDNQWNLIVQSCKCCNNKKSDLEDDISALTLALCIKSNQNLSESTIQKIKRKIEKCVSRKTKKTIENSIITGGASLSYIKSLVIDINYKAPAQLETDRCFELARYHLMAFFYFVSFNEETMEGGFFPEGFHPAFQAPYSDWGNVEQIEFMKAVSNWQPKFLGITANGFFKIIIKKHPLVSCWSWAVEWNKSYRLLGFLGCRRTAEDIVHQIPKLQWQMLTHKQETTQYYREEVKLNDNDDTLFNINNA